MVDLMMNGGWNGRFNGGSLRAGIGIGQINPRHAECQSFQQYVMQKQFSGRALEIITLLLFPVHFPA